MTKRLPQQTGRGHGPGNPEGTEVAIQAFPLTGSEETGVHWGILAQLSVGVTDCRWTRLPSAMRPLSLSARPPPSIQPQGPGVALETSPSPSSLPVGLTTSLCFRRGPGQ